MINSIDYSNYIINICNNEYMELMSMPNVVGIAFSYKFIDGEVTSIECIQVLVDKKLPLSELSIHHIIPHIYKGVKTDVYECGTIEALSNESNQTFNCGDSVGALYIGSSGTAGAVVKSPYNKNYYLLSNNHVIAGANSADIGVPVLHPAPYDGGVYPQDQIASLSKFIPLKFDDNGNFPMNKVDCAIAKIKDPSFINMSNLPYGKTYEFIGQEVKKLGRSTGLTTGKVMSIGATVKVNYSSVNKKALFKNQIVTTPMSEKGDSGSLLLDKYNRGVGLLFSGTKNITLYNKIKDVLSLLNVKLVTTNNYAP